MKAGNLSENIWLAKRFIFAKLLVLDSLILFMVNDVNIIINLPIAIINLQPQFIFRKSTHSYNQPSTPIHLQKCKKTKGKQRLIYVPVPSYTWHARIGRTITSHFNFYSLGKCDFLSISFENFQTEHEIYKSNKFIDNLGLSYITVVLFIEV